jgi:cytochrome c oxidase cbb3-type subunit I/II
VGGKYPNIWHLRHLENPRSISPGSNMPNFPWLLSDRLDTTTLPRKIAVMRKLGVPYPDWSDEEIDASVQAQSQGIARDLRASGATVAPDREIIALIAYLQQLGHYQKVVPSATAPTLAD